MRGDELGVLAGEGGLLTRQAAEGVLGVAQAQVARLVEGAEGLGNAGDGGLVRGYVEVGYCVPDELGANALAGWTIGKGRGGKGRTVEGSSSRSILVGVLR